MARKGNWRHGKRSREAIRARKRSVAIVKASAILLGKLGAVKGRLRRAPLRPDQLPHLPLAWRGWFPGAQAVGHE